MKTQLIGKFSRWGVRIVLALLVLLALFVFEENIRGRIMLARYKAELRAKGEKLTLGEFEHPQLPKEGNGTEALLAAASELETVLHPDPLSCYGLESVKFLAPGRVVARLRIEQLPDRRPVDPARGRRSWAEPPPPPPPRSWSELAADVDQASPSLGKAKEAVKQSDIGVDLNYREGLDLKLPHLSKTRTVARWLVAAALSDAHEGNLGRATEGVVAVTELTEFSKHERMLVSQITRVKIAELGLQATWDILQSDGWTEEQLARLQQAWQSDELVSDIVLCAEVDRVIYLREFEKSLRWPNLGEMSWSRMGMTIPVLIRETLRAVLWRLAWARQDELKLLQRWQQTINNVRTAGAGRAWIESRARFQATENDERRRGWGWYDNWRFPLSGALGAGGYDFWLKNLMHCETQRSLAIAAIAVKRYELRSGKPPPSLKALVPEFLSEAPRDYMDGKPLRYRLTTDSAPLLYSVGEDGVDDGGDPSPLPPSSAYGIWRGRDEVWPTPATPEEVEAWNIRRAQLAEQGGRIRGLK